MKLAIGTAQFGNKYGITNTSFKLKQGMANKILDVAREHSIEFLDTASSYGESEKIIGKAIRASDNFKIISKTIKFDGMKISNSDLINLEEQFYLSLKRMKQNSIYGLLVHRPSDLIKKNGERIFKKLIDLKRKKLLKKIGISVDDKEKLELLIEKFPIDIVQIPINIFNQTFVNDELLVKLKSKKIEIHVRSIFFQGILLNERKLNNKVVEFFDPYVKKLKKELEDRKIEILNVALRFVDQIQHIDVGVVGVLNQNQLIEIIKAHEQKIENIDFLSEYKIKSKYVNPNFWKQL